MVKVGALIDSNPVEEGAQHLRRGEVTHCVSHDENIAPAVPLCCILGNSLCHEQAPAQSWHLSSHIL